MAQKFILIGFIVFLIGAGNAMEEEIETILLDKYGFDDNGLQMMENPFKFESLFKQDVCWKNSIKLTCPKNYRLCTEAEYFDGTYRHCFKTTKSAVNVKFSTRTIKLRDCKEVATIDPIIIKLLESNQNFKKNLDQQCDSCCVVNAKEGKKNETRYFLDELRFGWYESDQATFRDIVKKMNKQIYTATIPALNYQYEIFCGTQKEVQDYENPPKEKKTKHIGPTDDKNE